MKNYSFLKIILQRWIQIISYTREEKEYHDSIANSYATKQSYINGWQIAEQQYVWKHIHKLNSHNDVNKILDIGCGPAINSKKNLDYFQIEPYKYLGIDISHKFANIAKQAGLNVLVRDFSDFSENMKFDIITAFGFLHHIKNVDETFNKMTRLLKKSGFLFMREPNQNAFTEWMGDSPHEHPIDPSHLIKLALNSNLKVKKGDIY